MTLGAGLTPTSRLHQGTSDGASFGSAYAAHIHDIEDIEASNFDISRGDPRAT